MKREELMINDIVFDYTNSPVKVCAVGQDIVVKNSFGIGSLEPNELSPIPLTEEILDGNNFFQDHKYFTLGITKETRIVLKRIDEEDNKWYAGVITVFDEIGHAHIYYVHQLQHLLLLVGVQKEIEL